MGYKFDHIAIGVERIADSAAFMGDRLGGRPWGGGPGLGFAARQWHFEGDGRLELISPGFRGGGFMRRFLDARGPGVHHVTFKVPDFEAAAEHTRRLGYEVVGYNGRFPGWKEFFVHPKQADGIVLQFVRSAIPAGLAKGVLTRIAPARTPSTEIVGLRFNQHHEATALRQWRDLCRGQAGGDGNTMVFQWPNSSMRVAVDIDPSVPVGPRFIEVRTPGDEQRAIEGNQPLLGTRFVSTTLADESRLPRL